MIVRIWWPLQVAVRRRPLHAVAALAGIGGGAVAWAWQAHWPRSLLLAALGGGLALLVQIHGVGAQILAGTALVAALALAVAFTADLNDLLLLTPGVALLLGAAAELARRRPAHHCQHGIGRATTFLALGAQFLLIGAIDRPVVLVAFMLAAALGIAVVAPLAPRPGGAAPDLEPITGDRAGPWTELVPLLLLLLALPWPASGDAVAPWPTVAVLAVLWSLMTMDVRTTVAVLLGLVGGAALAVSLDLPGDRGALAVAQLVPLLTWMARGAQGGVPWQVRFASSAVLAAACLAFPEWLPGGLMALGATVGLALVPQYRAAPGHGLDSVRRWLHRLDPAWRWYGVAKLRLDPLYRQLADDARPWGRVLDVGCGSGLGTALAAARPGTHAYHGVDLDRDKLLVARRMSELAGRHEWRLDQATAPFADPPSGAFDTVLLLDVLHYWPPATQAAVLSQIHHLLADDGVLWLRESVSGAGRVASGERFTTWMGLNPRGALHFTDEQGLRDLMTATGFVIASVADSGGDNRLFSVRKTLGHAPGEAVGHAGHEGGEAGQPAAGA